MNKKHGSLNLPGPIVATAKQIMDNHVKLRRTLRGELIFRKYAINTRHITFLSYYVRFRDQIIP